MRYSLLLILICLSCGSQQIDRNEDYKKVKKFLKNPSSFDPSTSKQSLYDGELNQSFRNDFLSDRRVDDLFYFIGASVSSSFENKSMDQSDLLQEANTRALIKVLQRATSDVKVFSMLASYNGRHKKSAYLQASVTLKGIKYGDLTYDEYQCVVKKVPHPDLSFHYKRECRVVLKIPTSVFATSTMD